MYHSPNKYVIGWREPIIVVKVSPPRGLNNTIMFIQDGWVCLDATKLDPQNLHLLWWIVWHMYCDLLLCNPTMWPTFYIFTHSEIQGMKPLICGHSSKSNTYIWVVYFVKDLLTRRCINSCIWWNWTMCSRYMTQFKFNSYRSIKLVSWYLVIEFTFNVTWKLHVVI